jgi:hypothetical protein
MSKKYKMTISRLTVDKLGVKLYDRVSAVMAEIVANIRLKAEQQFPFVRLRSSKPFLAVTSLTPITWMKCVK